MELKSNFVGSRLCYFYYYENPDIKYAFGSMWCDAGKAIYCLNFIITPVKSRGQRQFLLCRVLIFCSIEWQIIERGEYNGIPQNISLTNRVWARVFPYTFVLCLRGYLRSYQDIINWKALCLIKIIKISCRKAKYLFLQLAYSFWNLIFDCVFNSSVRSIHLRNLKAWKVGLFNWSTSQLCSIFSFTSHENLNL